MEVKSTDQTEASDVIQYKVDSATGTASATTQKKVKDDTTNESSLVGEPSDLALTEAEQATLIAACDASIASILAARTSAAQQAAPATEEKAAE